MPNMWENMGMLSLNGNTNHTLLVGGVACATWNHGLIDPFIYHPFFGTRKVLEAIRQRDPEGWVAGLV